MGKLRFRVQGYLLVLWEVFCFQDSHSSSCILDSQPQSLAGLHVWALSGEDS